MSSLKQFLKFIPEVKGPTQQRLSFKEKIKWTSIILVSFFILSTISLFGLGQNSLAQFEQLSIILGASFGSIISLGIGPIVTASIVLQLLTGAGIINIDQNTPQGREFFQGLNRLLGIFFILLEACIYVFMGGLAPATTLTGGAYLLAQWLLVIQLVFGGFLIMLMAEVVDKWGLGQGISIFIAAGVSQQIIIRLISPLTQAGTLGFPFNSNPSVGAIWVLISSIINANITEALVPLFAIIFTFVVFAVSVYAQAMKVEIPLSFGRIRGHGIRWPLRFLYTSNIPVILVAALIANLQLWARLLQNKAGSTGFLAWISQYIFGQFSGSQPISGLVYWTNSPNLVESVIRGFLSIDIILQALSYTLFMVIGAAIFSLFWMQTSGMDAKSQAKKMMSSGLQIPGFRKDERVLEKLLKRYILPLTIMGGIAIGILAALADVTGALARGTGILLTVMIVYRLYEEVAEQHMMDMNPALRKMMQK